MRREKKAVPAPDLTQWLWPGSLTPLSIFAVHIDIISTADRVRQAMRGTFGGLTTETLSTVDTLFKSEKCISEAFNTFQ